MSQTRVRRNQVFVGRRKVSDQNFSKIIALPKNALINCGNPSHFDIMLVQDGDETFLKLVPIHKGNEDA